MLAAISHDLRTPLTRLRLRAEFVDDPEQQRKMLADLEEMEAMIASTLAFARDDARKEPRVTIDLAALLQSLVDDLSDAGDTMDMPVPEHRTFGCVRWLSSRAIGNLIDNALEVRRLRPRDAAGSAGARTCADQDRRRRSRHPRIGAGEVLRPLLPPGTLPQPDTAATGLGLSVARTISPRPWRRRNPARPARGPGLSATLILAEAVTNPRFVSPRNGLNIALEGRIRWAFAFANTTPTPLAGVDE